jgi:hypothetical protein
MEISLPIAKPLAVRGRFNPFGVNLGSAFLTASVISLIYPSAADALIDRVVGGQFVALTGQTYFLLVVRSINTVTK